MTHPSVNSIVERLEPCPFCGPGNSIVECYQDDYGYWKVGCGACGSHSGIRPKSDPDGRAKVVARWNNRPAATIISELQAQNERKDRLVEAHRQQIIDAGEIMKHWQARALAAESSLSRIKAETIEAVRPFEKLIRLYDGYDTEFGKPLNVGVEIADIRKLVSAIRSLGSTGGGDAEEGSTQKEGSR